MFVPPPEFSVVSVVSVLYSRSSTVTRSNKKRCQEPFIGFWG
jgi:hypothetical protein